MLIVSRSSSHRGRCWEAGGRRRLGVGGRAGGGGGLVPVRLLGSWSWAVGLLSSWSWTVECFSL